MESPKSDENSIDISPSAQKSPFSKFLNNLSPIKSSKALRYTQRLSESSLPTTLSVFSSPHLDSHRETSFHKREDVAGSSSNANNEAPPPPSCFNASEVGAQALPQNLANKQLVELSSDDESIDERFDKILEFSSDNIWDRRVESDHKILENHVGHQASQNQQGIRRHLQFEATTGGRFDATFNCYTSCSPGFAFHSGGNSAQVPSMVVRANNVAESVSVSSDVFSSNKFEQHRHWSSNNLLQINDHLTSSAREIGDHLDSEPKVVADGGHLHTNIESPWNSQKVSYVYQQTLPWEGKMPVQQFPDRVDEPSQFQDSTKGKRKRETYTAESAGCKLCNCKRSKCLKLYCECFAAGIYCADSCACEDCYNNPDYEDTVLDIRQQIESRNPLAFAPAIVKQADNSPNVVDDGMSTMTLSSARHKRGCKCKKSKCLKKYCECYRAKVGCSDGCRCEDCDNSFGKKSEPMFERVGRQKNLSHENLNSLEIMSGGTANQFSPTWEELADITHASPPFSQQYSTSRPLPPPHSHQSHHLTISPNDNMGNCLNVAAGHASQSENQSGLQLSPAAVYLQWCSSNSSSALTPTQMQPCVNDMPHELGSVIMEDDGSSDIMVDMENNSTTNTNVVKSGSPNQKRVSPPPLPSSLSSKPGLRSSRKLNLQDVPSFPHLLTPYYNSQDPTENDHNDQ